MKLLISNYTFNKTAKTVTFTDYTLVNLAGVLLITNVESNIIIYNFADSTKGGSMTNNVLTLDYDTSSMSNTDKLQIYYDDGLPGMTATDIDNTTGWTLRMILRLLKPLGIVTTGTNRLSVDVNSAIISSGTITTVGTVTTITNLPTIGGISAIKNIQDTSRNTYANGIRNNLSF